MLPKERPTCHVSSCAGRESNGCWPSLGAAGWAGLGPPGPPSPASRDSQGIKIRRSLVLTKQVPIVAA